MDLLPDAYAILCAADRTPDAPCEAWCDRMRTAVAEGKADVWPIAAPNEARMVGVVLFAADTVHIAIHPEWQGRWATRALRRAYDTWTHAIPIRAPIQPDNHRAIALAKRLGFQFREDQGMYHLYVKEPNREPTV